MIKIKIRKQLIAAEGKMDLAIDLEVKEREFITLFGKSGAGKTTILRILAGLTQPDEGLIKVDNEIWLDVENKINLSPQKREIGFVFQDYTLFPNMTVKENLEYALENKKDNGVIDKLLEIVDLKELQNRRPDTLSGGQKQRTALARALVRKPKILLLDEPLSALDAEMRLRLQDEIIKIHKQFNITTILASHDLAEILKLSNKVFFIEKGLIVKSGKPPDVFTKDKISGKFKFVGEILDIQKDEVVYILTVLIGNNIAKVIATEAELEDLKIGDKVTVVSKAFNPIIMKI